MVTYVLPNSNTQCTGLGHYLTLNLHILAAFGSNC